MKRLLSLYAGAIILAIAFFSSCETDLEKITASAQNAPGNVTTNNNNPYVCSAANATDVAFTISWTEADFGEHIACTYILQFDVAGNNFAAPYEITAGNNMTKKSLVSNDLNLMMHRLGQPVGVPTNIEVRVKAQPMVVGSSQPELEKIVSQSDVTINLTSYAMPPVHMIGSMFDNYFNGDPYFWNNANYRYVMFRDNPLAENIYVAKFFGFNASQSVGEIALLYDLGSWSMINRNTATAGVLVNSGGTNIKDITTDGYYTFTANMSNMTYRIMPYDAGNATTYTSIEMTGAGGSPVALTPMVNNPHIWAVDDIALQSTYKIRFQANGSAAVSWGSDTFPWGKGTTGGEDISVYQAGNYFIKFNDLTGHYVFYKK